MKRILIVLTVLLFLPVITAFDFYFTPIQPKDSEILSKNGLVITKTMYPVRFIISIQSPAGIGKGFSREETDENGNGLGRYDILNTQFSGRIYGMNGYEFSGSAEEIHGLKTPVIVPRPDGRVFLDLSVSADSLPIMENNQNGSCDAGIYAYEIAFIPIGL